VTKTKPMKAHDLRELARQEIQQAKRLHEYNIRLDAALAARPLRVRDVLMPSRATLAPRESAAKGAEAPKGC
jgi:hypothetical protein